jgi:hypothetical protein
LSYFKYSREDFETVKENYPAHVSVTRYLDDSKSKVGTNEDKTPKWTRSQRKLYMNIALGMMILSVLGMVAIFVWGIFDRKKKGFVGQFSQVSQVVPPVTTAPSSLPPPPSPPSGF